MVNRKEILIPALSGVAIGLLTWFVAGSIAHGAAFAEHADYTKWASTDALAVDEKTGDNIKEGLEKTINAEIKDDPRIALASDWKLPTAIGLGAVVVTAVNRRIK